MQRSNAYEYDEFTQVGTDYSDPAEVEVYDETHAGFRDFEAECRIVLDSLRVKGGDTVIDIGCGTGVFAVYAARQGVRVQGVDVSEAMLQRARQRVAATAVDGVSFAHAGFLTYEHRGAPADGVVSTLALHHLPDFWKGVALARVRAMLKPGGRFCLQDVVLQEPNALGDIRAFIDKQHAAGGDFLRQDAEKHFREEYSTYDWIMAGLLERAGFTIESIAWSDGVFARYCCV